MKSNKRLLRIDAPHGTHWVGDGFPVRTLFSYASHSKDVSPFLLFDYAGPKLFEPSDHPRGVEEHPHRGFETVTIVYSGGLQHRDSSGSAGKIGPGDVQWMTAASGVVHEEMHSEEFTKSGGLFEVVQLWVNLPASEKMSTPRYQELVNSAIPAVDQPFGKARVIAGQFGGVTGPAKTVTPLEVVDLRFEQSGTFSIDVPEGHTLTLANLDAVISVEGREIGPAQIAVFETAGERIEFEVKTPGKALLLAGEPIAEPISGQGPFVMNTQQEIWQAISDFQAGRMGRLEAVR